MNMLRFAFVFLLPSISLMGDYSRGVKPVFVADELLVTATVDLMPRVIDPNLPPAREPDDMFAEAGVTVLSDESFDPPEVVRHFFRVRLNDGTKFGEAFRRIQQFDFGVQSSWHLNWVGPNHLIWLDPQPAGANRVFNMSTRAEVGQGDRVAIGGFVVPGEFAKSVVIKVRGASLSSFGVEGALEDPVLKLHQGQNLIFENDNWEDRPDWEWEAARQICPVPDDPREAMIYTMLDPGAYTAVIESADGQAGVALIEVYLRDQFHIDYTPLPGE